MNFLASVSGDLHLQYPPLAYQKYLPVFAIPEDHYLLPFQTGQLELAQSTAKPKEKKTKGKNKMPHKDKMDEDGEVDPKLKWKFIFSDMPGYAAVIITVNLFVVIALILILVYVLVYGDGGGFGMRDMKRGKRTL